MCEEMFDFIRELVPSGRILELGSGRATEALDKYYTVYSIEHDKEWVGKYHGNYIHAPIRKHKEIKNYKSNEWYDANVLRRELPKIKYDLLIVDGPIGEKRSGIVKYWELFDWSVPAVFDDMQRDLDYHIIKSISNKLDRPFVIYEGEFGVIYPPATQVTI